MLILFLLRPYLAMIHHGRNKCTTRQKKFRVVELSYPLSAPYTAASLLRMEKQRDKMFSPSKSASSASHHNTTNNNSNNNNDHRSLGKSETRKKTCRCESSEDSDPDNDATALSPNKAGYTAQDAPSMRSFHLRK